MILALLLGLLFFIFYRLSITSGAINVIAKAISREMFISMTYLLHSKGKYGKSLILSLISIGLFIVMS